MLGFGKKKDNTNNLKTSPKPTAKKSPEPPVGKEEIKHLEETKHRLFGFVGKKSSKIKELSANFDVKNGKEAPAPPPKPIRLTHSNIQHPHRKSSTDIHSLSPIPNVSSPDTPFDGEEFGFHPLKTFAFPGLNLPALKSANHCERNIRLKRLPTGEFNVALRRAQIVDRRDLGQDDQSSRIVFFVDALNPDYETHLQPGDTLIAVDGVPIEQLNKSQVVQMISSCENEELELRVRPVSELSNFSVTNGDEFNSDYNLLDTARGDLNLFQMQKPQELIAVAANHSSDVVDCFSNEINTRVWLAHKDGFSLAKLFESVRNMNENRKIKIQLENNGQIVEVDSDDVEKANPTSLDNVENLKELTYLNECSVLHLLRRRFANNLIHTFANSQNMLVVDSASTSMSMYSEKVMNFFKDCRRNLMPPHIYAVAQKTYRSMMSNRKSQAVVFAGRSGTGKTQRLKHFLQYLSSTVGSTGKFLTLNKLNAALFLLESFGNARTLMNLNASRFATLFTLDFDQVGQISGVFIQGLLLEHHRVVRRHDGERNFNILYYFWFGLDQELKNEFFLNSIEDIQMLMSADEKTQETDSFKSSWIRLCGALKTLQIPDLDIKAIWTSLAAIFHLAAAGATKGIPSFKSTFLKPIHAQKAAQLLGVPLEDLQKTIFISQHHDQQVHREQRLSSSSNSRPSLANPRRTSDNEKLTRKDIGPARLSLEKMSITDRPGDGLEALEAFLIGLYRELFSAVVCLINKSLNVQNSIVSTSICLVDCPGYQRPPADPTQSATTNKKISAGLGEFFFNYLNERLNGLFYQSCISKTLELYNREQIDFDFGHDIPAPYSVIDLIDRQLQQQMLKSTNLELRSQEKRGLLWLLDEESIFPGASDESFMERIFVHHGDRKDNLLKKSRRHNSFVVRHALGSYPVSYNVCGWLKLAQENPLTRSVLPLLQNSRKDFLSSLYMSLRSSGLPGLPPSLSAYDSGSLRRTTTVFKTLVAPQTVIKRKSNCSMCKLQADLIVENVLRMGAAYFVHCLQSHEEMDRNRSDAASETNFVDVPLVRNQLRSFQLLEAVRLDKIGYPEHMTFGDFKKRFECLAPSADYKPSSTLLDDKIAVERLLIELDVAQTTNDAVLGLSRIFLKSELLLNLEDRRDEKLSVFVTRLQAVCRSFLAKKRLEKRKIQTLSIRCIQKNINKYMKVKSWPWWRLYTRVAPLVNVNRTDEELRTQAEELEHLRTKTMKLDKSYAELRSHCDRLEAKLVECQAELTDERNVSTMATEALEYENKTRLRIEKEFNDIQTKFAAVTSANQKMEMQILEFKSLKNASILVSSGDEDDETQVPTSAVGTNGGTGNLMRDRIREMKKQIEVQRKTFTLEKMDEIEHHTSLRKQTEKKLSEYQKENEELHETVNVHKRRTQKMNDELQDLRTHLQQVTSRNVELEKKQKRFDTEMNAVKELLQQEKVQRERIAREKDETTSKCYILEQEMKQKFEDIVDLEEKCRRYENESSPGGVSLEPSNDALLKKRNLELERKCTDLESEMDEMAGEILQLQQNVTRLEMQSNKIKRDQTKEMEKQDEEIDHVRSQMSKKVKILEQQLDEEHDANQRHQRQIRELEAQLRDAQENKNIDRDESREHVLKRNMRKTKALLKDAQVMLEHYQKSAPNRGVVKQLKNQLEDAEALRLAAVKAKQSLENEMEELRRDLATVLAHKNSSEERCMSLLREKTTLDVRINDQDYEMQELLKKYKAQVQQGSVAHITLNDQIRRIADLEKERDALSDKIVELSAHLERFEADTVDKHKLYLTEGKVRDLESKLDLELTTKARLEAVITKSKEDCERLREDMSVLQAAKDRETELSKRFQQQVQNAQDSSLEAQKRDAETTQRCRELTSAFERLEQENATTLADLKLSLRRIDDLQIALQSDDDSDPDKYDDDDAEDEEGYSFARPASVSNYSDARSGRRSGSTPSRTSTNN